MSTLPACLHFSFGLDFPFTPCLLFLFLSLFPALALGCAWVLCEAVTPAVGHSCRLGS